MRKLILALLCCLFLTASAYGESVSGQPYATFESYYSEDIQFINDNLNRHMLPLVIAKTDAGAGDGRIFYQIFGDVLSLIVRTDPSGAIIEMCQIIITAPSGMEPGNSVYNDFAISGYQSYALLMAMDSSPAAYERYQLVTAVEEGLKQGGGTYSAQMGVYRLNCQSANGTVTITFDNGTTAAATTAPGGGLDEADGGEPAAPAETSDPNNTDEGAGMG